MGVSPPDDTTHGACPMTVSAAYIEYHLTFPIVGRLTSQRPDSQSVKMTQKTVRLAANCKVFRTQEQDIQVSDGLGLRTDIWKKPGQRKQTH